MLSNATIRFLIWGSEVRILSGSPCFQGFMTEVSLAEKFYKCSGQYLGSKFTALHWYDLRRIGVIFCLRVMVGEKEKSTTSKNASWQPSNDYCRITALQRKGTSKARSPCPIYVSSLYSAVLSKATLGRLAVKCHKRSIASLKHY